MSRLDLVVIAGASAIVALQVGFLGVSAGSALIQSLPALMGRHAACASDTTVLLDSRFWAVTNSVETRRLLFRLV
jgi:hypothetical protein